MGETSLQWLKREGASRGSSPRGRDDGGEVENGRRRHLAVATECPQWGGSLSCGGAKEMSKMGAGKNDRALGCFI
jgi:hypothetical protein